VERCFSSIYYLLAGRGKHPQTNEAIGNVARALIGVHAPDQQTVQVKANADTGGSKYLASKHLLQNVKRAEEFGRKPVCMLVTIQGVDSPGYTHQGELDFSDENGTPIILLRYVQKRPIPGHEHFVLISNNTLVDISADINFHARASKEIGVLPLRRTTSEAFHYQDEATRRTCGETAVFSAKAYEISPHDERKQRGPLKIDLVRC
jgi:hypothetical protein